MKKKLIFIFWVVITVVACKTKEPLMYSSYYKKAIQRYYFKGPVKKSRQYYNFYNTIIKSGDLLIFKGLYLQKGPTLIILQQNNLK